MPNLLRHARFGFRLLGKHPGFAAVAVLTLAIGIAANTAIFSVIYATSLAPLPYRDPERLVMVWSYMGGDRIPNTPAAFDTWKRQTTVFEDLNAWSWRSVSVVTDAGPEQFQAGPATPGFLPMLGYGHPLAFGRTFLDEEGTPGRDNVVVLSHRLWRERFGRDEGMIGRAIRINGKPHSVVGVLGAGPPDHNQMLGTLFGSIGAYFASRAMRGMLYGVGVADPTTFILVGLVLLAAAFIACFVPARRAASLDPMIAPRQE